jgi:hypothetical protein
MATLGGKDRRPAGSREVVKTPEAFLAEAVEPVADDVPIDADEPGDAADRLAVGCQQDDPRSASLTRRNGGTAGEMDQLGSLLDGE